MPLHPFFAKYLEENKRPGLDVVTATMDIALVRAFHQKKFEEAVAAGVVVLPQIAKKEDRTIDAADHTIPIRIYTPEGSGPFPILVYFHGGGFVVGFLGACDSLCITLANAAQCIVISVDYRLAPEHKFPKGVEDAYHATAWARDHAPEINGNPSKIAVGGDSSGGNFTAVVSILARERHGAPLVHQLLFYPSTDKSRIYPSTEEFKEGYGYSYNESKWFFKQYVTEESEKQNWMVSPILADLKGLPSATIITAEYDILRDEGEALAKKLKDAGVPVTHKRVDGAIHGFLSYADATVDVWSNTVRFAADRLAEAFA